MTPELDALLCQRHPQLFQHRHTDPQTCAMGWGLQLRGSPLVRINLRETNIHNPDAIELALGAREALERMQQHIDTHA